MAPASDCGFRQRTQASCAVGTRPFEPYGQPMRAWAFLEPPAPEQLRTETAVLKAAIDRTQRAGTAK